MRLDERVVTAGLAETREAARRLIRAGKIGAGGRVLDKPGRLVEADLSLERLGEPPPYVSRGGLKLAGALDRLGLRPPPGGRALDIGASTGGFTDCLLQRGAGEIVAVDVGRGQLHERLRADPRVVVREGLNARRLRRADVGDRPFDLIVIDVAFISLRLILPVCPGLLAAGGGVLALVKPQFEAGRGQVGRGGVVRRREVHRDVLQSLLKWCRAEGWAVEGLVASPLRGADGNLEFFLRLSWPGRGATSGEPAGGGEEHPPPRPSAPTADIDVERVLDEAYNAAPAARGEA